MMMLSASTVYAADIKLPEPSTSGGIPLMDAIAARRSGRTFDTKMLSDKHLSDLLWATWGISSEDGKRVVPTARNRQDIDLYVLIPSGSYIYDAKNNALKQLGSDDFRYILAKDQNLHLMPLFIFYSLQKIKNMVKCTQALCIKMQASIALPKT